MYREHVSLHIPNEPSTCGNWCARAFYFSLIALLFGILSFLIVNAPLKESLFLKYSGEEVKKHYENHNLVDNIFEENKYIANVEYIEKTIIVNVPDEISLLRKEAQQASEKNDGADSEENTLTTQIISHSAELKSFDDIDFIEAELKRANEAMSGINLKTGMEIYESMALNYPNSPAALYGKINALKRIATISHSFEVLRTIVKICLSYLVNDGNFPDEDFKKLSYFCITQMRTINILQPTIRIHLQLVKRFDDDPNTRNELSDTYIDLYRYSDAQDILEENLKRWPNNGISLVNYGYILLLKNRAEEGVHYIRLGIETDDEGTKTRFLYYVLGETLFLLNRTDEARQVYRKGVANQLFQNEYQRPMEFIKGLTAQPFWTKEETTYSEIYNLLESNWRQIRDEGLSILNDNRVCHEVRENLTHYGNWEECVMYRKGIKNIETCKNAQFTCALIDVFVATHPCTCSFSVIYPGTHVRRHCGPENTRLRAHLGLKIPKGVKIQIVEDERSWEEGKFLIFDDSFEHELWHNGNSIRLILLLDLWHPHLTENHKTEINSKRTDKWSNRRIPHK